MGDRPCRASRTNNEVDGCGELFGLPADVLDALVQCLVERGELYWVSSTCRAMHASARRVLSLYSRRGRPSPRAAQSSIFASDARVRYALNASHSHIKYSRVLHMLGPEAVGFASKRQPDGTVLSADGVPRPVIGCIIPQGGLQAFMRGAPEGLPGYVMLKNRFWVDTTTLEHIDKLWVNEGVYLAAAAARRIDLLDLLIADSVRHRREAPFRGWYTALVCSDSCAGQPLHQRPHSSQLLYSVFLDELCSAGVTGDGCIAEGPSARSASEFLEWLFCALDRPCGATNGLIEVHTNAASCEWEVWFSKFAFWQCVAKKGLASSVADYLCSAPFMRLLRLDAQAAQQAWCRQIRFTAYGAIGRYADDARSHQWLRDHVRDPGHPVGWWPVLYDTNEGDAPERCDVTADNLNERLVRYREICNALAPYGPQLRACQSVVTRLPSPKVLEDYHDLVRELHDVEISADLGWWKQCTADMVEGTSTFLPRHNTSMSPAFAGQLLRSDLEDRNHECFQFVYTKCYLAATLLAGHVRFPRDRAAFAAMCKRADSGRDGGPIALFHCVVSDALWDERVRMPALRALLTLVTSPASLTVVRGALQHALDARGADQAPNSQQFRDHAEHRKWIAEMTVHPLLTWALLFGDEVTFAWCCNPNGLARPHAPLHLAGVLQDSGRTSSGAELARMLKLAIYGQSAHITRSVLRWWAAASGPVHMHMTPSILRRALNVPDACAELLPWLRELPLSDPVGATRLGKYALGRSPEAISVCIEARIYRTLDHDLAEGVGTLRDAEMALGLMAQANVRPPLDDEVCRRKRSCIDGRAAYVLGRYQSYLQTGGCTKYEGDSYTHPTDRDKVYTWYGNS